MISKSDMCIEEGAIQTILLIRESLNELELEIGE